MAKISFGAESIPKNLAKITPRIGWADPLTIAPSVATIMRPNGLLYG
jgi:hypothetical protein